MRFGEKFARGFKMIEYRKILFNSLLQIAFSYILASCELKWISCFALSRGKFMIPTIYWRKSLFNYYYYCKAYLFRISLGRKMESRTICRSVNYECKPLGKIV